VAELPFSLYSLFAFVPLGRLFSLFRFCCYVSPLILLLFDDEIPPRTTTYRDLRKRPVNSEDVEFTTSHPALNSNFRESCGRRSPHLTKVTGPCAVRAKFSESAIDCVALGHQHHPHPRTAINSRTAWRFPVARISLSRALSGQHFAATGASGKGPWRQGVSRVPFL
jgi:hypothetical protein